MALRTATAAVTAVTTGRRVLDVLQVAMLLGIHPSTVRTWVRRGVFPAPLRSSHEKWLWPAKTIEDLIGGREAEEVTLRLAGQARAQAREEKVRRKARR
jgi:hypothetical protein